MPVYGFSFAIKSTFKLNPEICNHREWQEICAHFLKLLRHLLELFLDCGFLLEKAWAVLDASAIVLRNPLFKLRFLLIKRSYLLFNIFKLCFRKAKVLTRLLSLGLDSHVVRLRCLRRFRAELLPC